MPPAASHVDQIAHSSANRPWASKRETLIPLDTNAVLDASSTRRASSRVTKRTPASSCSTMRKVVPGLADRYCWISPGYAAASRSPLLTWSMCPRYSGASSPWSRSTGAPFQTSMTAATVAAGSISMPIRLPWPNASGHENPSPRDVAVAWRTGMSPGPQEGYGITQPAGGTWKASIVATHKGLGGGLGYKAPWSLTETAATLSDPVKLTHPYLAVPGI
jgi:hypothetical protein